MHPIFTIHTHRPFPWEELVELARADMNACKDIHCKETLRECAEKIVQSKVCSCATESAPIVQALVDEYLNKLGTGNSDHVKAVIATV